LNDEKRLNPFNLKSQLGETEKKEEEKKVAT